jgi:hypothetical protein
MVLTAHSSTLSDLNIVDMFEKIARFEVLTAVVMNSSISWDITPCSPLKLS